MNFPELAPLTAWASDSSLHVLLAAAIAVVLALLVHAVGGAVLLRLTQSAPVAASVARECRAPARLLLPLIALQAVWQGAPDDFPLIGGVRRVARGLIGLHPIDVADNLSARRVHTQTRMLARIASFAVLLSGLALMLMTFPGARQFGASLLASAGLVGLVAGIAARPIFSNLIAGLQIALAQPIRLDNVLVVQGEWGRVEEITGTYVVLRIWDERRLVIPLQWFIENPFQNWTRTSASIIGTVFLWVDYRMPLAPLRAEAQRVCEAAPEWDRRLCKLQVVEAGERSIQLRLLVSSAASGQNWDLRCKVREALVDFMQREYPQHLPMTRAELADPDRNGNQPQAK